MINTPISIGELIDKITILQIKSKKIVDPSQLININKELNLLLDVGKEVLLVIGDLFNSLKIINSTLWDTEDKIRDCEKQEDFGPGFISLARHIYILNDERSTIKKRINLLTCSKLIEEKSYSFYKKE